MPALDSMRRELEGKVLRVSQRVADQAVRELQTTAPVETGELRSEIEARVRGTLTGATITIESGASYAEFVRSHREQWDALLRRLPQMIEQAWRATR